MLLTGCTKKQEMLNKKPVLTFTHVSDGLKFTINGSATDPDGKIKRVTIQWGDGNGSEIHESSFADFEASHLYDSPGNYNLIVRAQDNEGDSVSQTLAVIVDFKETSLAGIKTDLFKSSENEYLILTINLHTYQESRQNEKLNIIADVIGKMDVDFICFQECAQHRNAAITGGIIREDNMALVISDRIKKKYGIDYHFAWGWAHYGWDIWEEGVAVLSRYPLSDSEDRYISVVTSTGSILSRKVIYASFQVSGNPFHIFSAHTHWRITLADEEQNSQINNIKAMVTEKELTSPDAVSFVCGDFNGNPTSDFPWSEGYHTMMKTGDYEDTFLEIYPDANLKPAQSIYNTIGGDFPGRIDYIFMKKNTRFRVAGSQIIFTNDAAGAVSDHNGVLTKIALIN